jgi:hypothetical protein
MKGFFLILIVVNLLLWSAWQGWLGADVYQWVNPVHSEPWRLQQQVNAQRIIVGERALRPDNKNDSANAPAPKDR